MSEKQFEECSLEEATHVEMGGKLYEIGEDDDHESSYQVLKYNRYYIKVYMESARWQLIQAYAFRILGINTLKEIKPKPIKFHHTFGGHSAAPLAAQGKTFLCVELIDEECPQILEDEK